MLSFDNLISSNDLIILNVLSALHFISYYRLVCDKHVIIGNNIATVEELPPNEGSIKI